MTQAPIHPHHKDMAAKAAGYRDYAEAKADAMLSLRGDRMMIAHAQTLANLEAAQADLAEIERIAVAGGFAQCLPGDPCLEIAAIAAPYRASDPVAEALREALTGANLLTDSELAEHFSEVFATRGLEIVERRDR